MKRTKVLALVLVVSIMLMGAGYAAWTDQLNINTEVKTGHLDLAFEDQGEAIELSMAEHVTGRVDYARDYTGDNDWDIANVKLGNMYPGAKATVKLKMVNNSTIPVEMRAIKDTRSANWGVNGDNFNQIGATARFYDSLGNALQFANTTVYANPWEPAHLANIQLPIGGYATIEFTFTAADGIDEEATYNFNPYVVWQQFNQDPLNANGTEGLLNIVETPLQGD